MEDPREYDLKLCPDCLGMVEIECRLCDDTRLVSIHTTATYDRMEG